MVAIGGGVLTVLAGWAFLYAAAVASW